MNKTDIENIELISYYVEKIKEYDYDINRIIDEIEEKYINELVTFITTNNDIEVDDLNRNTDSLNYELNILALACNYLNIDISEYDKLKKFRIKVKK